MHKYAKIMLILFIVGAVVAILFRPSGQPLTDRTDKSYLAVYEDAINRHMPVLIEFYGRY